MVSLLGVKSYWSLLGGYSGAGALPQEDEEGEKGKDGKKGGKADKKGKDDKGKKGKDAKKGTQKIANREYPLGNA